MPLLCAAAASRIFGRQCPKESKMGDLFQGANLIRVVAGVLAVVVLAIIIIRRRKQGNE